MLKEAGDFANHLKHCERDIRALKNATEGVSLRLIRNSMLSNISCIRVLSEKPPCTKLLVVLAQFCHVFHIAATCRFTDDNQGHHVSPFATCI